MEQRETPLLVVPPREFQGKGFVGRVHFISSLLADDFEVTVFDLRTPWKKLPTVEAVKEITKGKRIKIFKGYFYSAPNMVLNEIMNLGNNLECLRYIISRFRIRLVLNFSNIPLHFLLKKEDVKIVFDLFDPLSFLVNTHLNIPRFLRGTTSTFTEFLLMLVLAHSDHIVTSSFCLYRTLLNYGISKSSVDLISNGVFTDVFKPMSQEEKIQIKKRYGLHNSFVVGYCGVILKDMVEPFSEFFSAFKDFVKEYTNSKFLVIGDGEGLPSLRKIVFSMKLERSVIFTGPQPYQNLPQALSTFDAGILPFSPKNPRHYIPRPLKLFQYLSSGVPVVSPRLREVKYMFPESKRIVQYADTPQEIAGKLIALRENQSLAEAIATRGRRIAMQKFDWRILVSKYRNVISSLID